MLITIIGILAAPNLALLHPASEESASSRINRRPLVQNACGARGWTSLVDRVRHPQRRFRDHRRECRRLSFGCHADRLQDPGCWLKSGWHPTISQVVEARHLLLSAAILLALVHLLLQIIYEMLRPFLCQHFTRLVRYVRLLAQRLEFVPLRLGHHWFVHGRSFARWLFPASRRSALTPELW
jgi:hypothetical protein